MKTPNYFSGSKNNLVNNFKKTLAPTNLKQELKPDGSHNKINQSL